MFWKISVLSFWMAGFSLAQTLPDRDELAQKFLSPPTSHEAAASLIKHFQWGGLRTIIRKLNELSIDERLRWGEVLRHADLMRFRNDLNANLESAPDEPSRAMYLMLLATIGRQLDPNLFENHIQNASANIRLRLAAASGIIKVQSPPNYDRFHQLAKHAVIDPETGQNDFIFTDISKDNLGFFLYTKSKLDQNKVEHGVIVSAIAMADDGHPDIYELILDLKKRQYIPLLLDRAVRVGGVKLLDVMANHKTAKKYKDQVSVAMNAAKTVAQYRGKFLDRQDAETVPLGALLPLKGQGNGPKDLRAAYAVVKVAASGDISVVAHLTPFGTSNDNLKTLLAGTTLPGHANWKSVETYALITAP